MVDVARLGGPFRGLADQLLNADVVAVIDSNETGGVESIEQLIPPGGPAVTVLKYLTATIAS